MYIEKRKERKGEIRRKKKKGIRNIRYLQITKWK
jgi:hypothetical protein